MIKIVIVAGARPNFMKVAPIIEAIDKYNINSDKKINYCLVHTGQHYDQEMSKLFFDDLGIPTPDIELEVGSSSHAIQTAEIMKRFEPVCIKEKPSHVLVVGDVNSTIACALVASKLGIKIIHVEAGLRCYDRSMPEEINRVMTDAISDLLFTTEESANENLHNEGISKEKIHFVGNVMIDTLLKHKKRAQQSDILQRLGLLASKQNTLSPQCDFKHLNSSDDRIVPYAVLTLHRPSNVDNKATYRGILEALCVIGETVPIIFPIHPRTSSRTKEYGFEKYFNWELLNSINTTKHMEAINAVVPLGYLDFLNLLSNSKLVLTDSGGIQEETTIIGVSCVTIRNNTERPVTVTRGTNIIAGVKKESIIQSAFSALANNSEQYHYAGTGNSNERYVPPYWDGKAAKRIVDILVKLS